MDALWQSDIPGLPAPKRGKVRDIYDLGDHILLVATDRVSAFDVVLPTPIPGKGRVLNLLSAHWFRTLSDVVPNHMVTVDPAEFPPEIKAHEHQLGGRSMLVRKTRPLPVECIVRGYLAGSAWKEYRRSRSVCGIPLPEGLRESERLPEPLFTPSTKAPEGEHDENISFDRMVEIVGRETAEELRRISLELYRRAAAYAEARGILIADTKLEFGVDEGGRIVWIDEAFTPDSSRFWMRDWYTVGNPQNSLDKQYVRNYLEEIAWDKTPPGPELPREVVLETARRYTELFDLLTSGAPR